MPNQTPSLFHVHMPKTGGTSVHGAFNRAAGCSSRVGGGHDPASLHREAFGQRLVLGTLRNPWQWYRSLFEHVMNNNEQQRSQLSEWGGGSLRFRDVVYGWTGHRTGYRPRPGVIWEPVDGSAPAAGEGLWSWAVRYFYGSPWLVDVLLDTSQLDAGLRLLGVEPVERKNTREHRGAGRFVAMTSRDDEADLWDADMLGWVQEGDGELAASLGYVLPLQGRIGGPVYECRRLAA